MSSPQWDYIAKLVCIGDSGCGKSSLTVRLCEGRFVNSHDVTIGVEFGSRIVPVGPPHSLGAAASPNSNPAPAGLPPPPLSSPAVAAQKHMKLSLWDTAGQETYKSVTRSYFRGASGALLVFDLSRRSTFEHAVDWLNDLRQIAEPDIVVVLVGNKADLAGDDDAEYDADGDHGGQGDSATAPAPPSKRKVGRAEAEAWARRNGVLEYVETSAKSGAGVEHAFMRVADRIYNNIMAGKYDLNDRRSGVKGPGTAARNIPVRPAGTAGGAAGACC